MKQCLQITGWLVLGLITLFSCQQYPNKTQRPQKAAILGAWEMQEVHWILADTTYSITQAQPGLFIFNEDRYSIMWTPTATPRQPFKNLSKPTDEEALSGFRSVVFNGGTLTFSDSTITTTANIAKVPGFEGGKQYYRYEIKEDQLTLTMFDETYPDGKKPEWYGKVETQFVMRRAR